MQVFKLFFKVLRSNIGVMFMYIGIFVSVLIGVIIPSMVGDEEEGYTQSKSKFAVFDYDNSELSKELTGYLESAHNLRTIKNDDKETIQDELYMHNVACVVRINKGFSKGFTDGKSSEYLEIFAIPGTVTSVLFEQNLNSFLSVVNTYTEAGFDVSEAAKKALEVSEITASVEMVEESNSEDKGPVYFFYNYLAWIFIAMCVSGISVTLIALDKKNVRNRIECSSYKFVRMNMEIVLAVLVTGFVICGICVVISMMTFPEEMSDSNAFLYIINAFCIMSVALAITFFVSKVTDKAEIISLMSNILGLGMAFLCGVFVPLELLSDAVIKIAHFLPVYWYVKAVELIGTYESSDAGTLASYMGIQILFAVAIVCMGMIIARRKRGIAA